MEGGPWTCRCRRQISAAISPMENGISWVRLAQNKDLMSQKRDAFYLCELKDLGISLTFLSLAILDSLSPSHPEGSRMGSGSQRAQQAAMSGPVKPAVLE